MKLENRIRELRGTANLTLKQLSGKTDLSVSYLSDIERGRTRPSLGALESLAIAFEISVTDLLAGVDFAGEKTDASLPPGLKDLIEDKEFGVGLSEDWIQLLSRIELRGTRPTTKQEWVELYLHLRRILDND